jgi:hypothetical protein
VTDLDELLSGLPRQPPASDEAIAASEVALQMELPHEYVEFLKTTNGAEGFIGPSAYVMLWPVEQLDSLNHAYEIQKQAPGLLLFGSDGGGEAYGFDTRIPGWPIVQLPFVGMDWEDARLQGESFKAFLRHLRSLIE